MKIIFLNRFFFPDISATSQMLSDLAFHLAGRGHDVTVITSRQLYDKARAGLPAREAVNGVAIRRVAASTFGRGNLVGRALDYLTFYLSAAFALWRCAGPETIVVAKTDPPLISVPAALVCRLRGAKLVNWLQDVFPEVAQALGVRATRGLSGRLLRGLRDRSLSAASMTIVLGSRMERVILDLGIDPGKVRLIPNWADGRAIRPLARTASRFTREWGLHDNFVVCYSGNLGRAHEFRTALEAASLVQEQEGSSPRTVFLFIGGGAQRRFVEHTADGLALRNVRFADYQPRELLGESLAVGDIHLVSLRAELEGLIVPSKVYGILAAGRPLVFVGAEDGEVGQLVRDRGVGFAVEAGHGSRLADTLLRLRDDQALRARMGEKARQVFEEQFDFPISARKFEEVLRTVASR